MNIKYSSDSAKRQRENILLEDEQKIFYFRMNKKYSS